MNCLNGFFQGIYGEESLAETLLRRSGGAVAVWASSSLTDAEPQGVMNDELFRLVFNGSPGDARRRGHRGQERQSANPDVRRSWIFFGDPAMRLKGVPVATDPPRRPTLAVTPAAPELRRGDRRAEPGPRRRPARSFGSLKPAPAP